MNFGFHPVAQCPVNHLVLLNPALAGEISTYDLCFKMVSITGDFNCCAGEVFLNPAFDVLWLTMRCYPAKSPKKLVVFYDLLFDGFYQGVKAIGVNIFTVLIPITNNQTDAIDLDIVYLPTTVGSKQTVVLNRHRRLGG